MKTLRWLLLVFLLASPALAQVTSIPCNQLPALTGAVTTSAGSCATTSEIRQTIAITSGAVAMAQNTTYFSLAFPVTTEANMQALCPIGGTFKNLYAFTTAPASGQTVTATWRVANSDTSLTCTITGPATTCNDTTHTATCTAGQTYTLKFVTSATSGSITSSSGGVEFDNP